MLTDQEIIVRATEAANVAGASWLAQAQSWRSRGYVCGNAHVQFKDKRSSVYKRFQREGLVRSSGNGVVKINHDYLPRQEYGLRTACAEAALQSLEHDGIVGLRVWSYID